MNVGLSKSFQMAGFPTLHTNAKRSRLVTVDNSRNTTAVFIKDGIRTYM